MNRGANLIHTLLNLREKYRLSVRTRESDKELWYAHFTPAKALLLLFVYLFSLFIVVAMTVIYTPVLDLLPGYPGNKSREILISNIMRLDSMEQKVHNVSSYIDIQSIIIDGGAPISKDNTPIVDSIQNIFTPTPPSAEDSLLRAQLDSMGIYKLPELVQQDKILLGGMNLMPPVNGLVVNKFNPLQKRYGVDIATIENKPIMAISDGSVIFSTWTPEMGTVIHIQHSENLVSIYKNSTHILNDIGDIVKSGEVIGYTGEGVSGDESKDLMTFELWHNGVAVDPERYVWF